MGYVRTTDAPSNVKPPVTDVGVIGWIKKNLFKDVLNSILTIFLLFMFYKIIPPIFEWFFIDSLWNTVGADCKTIDGACWSVVVKNIRFILFGFYPYEQHWRPLTAMLILLSLLFFSRYRRLWNKKFLYLWLGAIPVMIFLMRGGIFGLTYVESTQWSGLPLTLILSTIGLTVAYPLGVILALGRQSRLPAIKSLCVVYIEMIRGVPLISLLFMSSVMFPLFLPEGLTIDKIVRAQAAIIFFTAAYIAEVVRGGLQAIPRGQFEAAEAIGLNYALKMRLIVLPQALKIVIPPTVSILISAFKDTSLVVIIALYDVLKTTQSVLSNPEWMGFSTEAYIFLALLYFAGCFSMSSFSRRLERDLDRSSH